MRRIITLITTAAVAAVLAGGTALDIHWDGSGPLPATRA